MLPLLDLQPIPFPGVVAAGKPFETIEGAEQFKVPRFLLSHGKNLALRVRGDSMVEAGIRDGGEIASPAVNQVTSGLTGERGF
jgi:SOS-response transcriptional repressor LexA